MPLDQPPARATIHLTVDELVDLTDRRMPSKQIQWLEQNGWKYIVSAAGRPKVSRAYYDRMMGAIDADPSDGAQEPDFSHWTEKKHHGGSQKEQSGVGHVQAVRLRRQAA